MAVFKKLLELSEQYSIKINMSSAAGKKDEATSFAGGWSARERKVQRRFALICLCRSVGQKMFINQLNHK